MLTCASPDCTKPVRAKGLCGPHYAKQHRRGNEANPVQDARRCRAKGCERAAKAKGLCSPHYMRNRRGEPIDGVPINERGFSTCQFNECGRSVHGWGLCAGHYWQQSQGRELVPIAERMSPGGECLVEACDRTAAHLGLCNTHYTRKSHGRVGWDRPIRDKAPDGSGWITKEGYRMLVVDGRRVFEHVHEFEKVLGRQVRTAVGENVHHVNGNKLDNRTDGEPRLHVDGRFRSGNLELWSTKQPAGQEIGPKLMWAREILALYGTDDEKGRYAAGSPLN
jgi:hypothetical protein